MQPKHKKVIRKCDKSHLIGFSTNKPRSHQEPPKRHMRATKSKKPSGKVKRVTLSLVLNKPRSCQLPRAIFYPSCLLRSTDANSNSSSLLSYFTLQNFIPVALFKVPCVFHRSASNKSLHHLESRPNSPRDHFRHLSSLLDKSRCFLGTTQDSPPKARFSENLRSSWRR